MNIKNLSLLILFSLSIFFANAQKKILFDNTKSEQAGNADWVIDTGSSQYPSPAQSGISGDPLPSPTGDIDVFWSGALSMWGIEMVKQGYTVETLPNSGNITYGDAGNTQDLSNYDIFVVCEPNDQFTAAEKTAMMNFVSNGGGLFMISDHDGADRNSNGWDAASVWNDFITSNSVQNNAFGFTFADGNSSSGSASNFTDAHSTNVASLPATDPLLHGVAGDVGGLEFHGGTSLILNTSDNSSVKAVIYRSGSANPGTTGVMCAYATYGSGRVVGLGDSSAAEDDTPNGGTTYTGWTQPIGSSEDKDNGTLVTNATIWLAGAPASTSIKKGPYMIYPNVNTEMTILWQLDGSETCTLSYGTTIAYGTDIAVTEYGASHQYKQTLTGLTAGTKYYYKVNFGSTDLTGSFTTAPLASEKEVKFLTYGDTRTFYDKTNEVTGRMLTEITGDAAYQTFSLHTGDWVNYGVEESDWSSQFFNRDANGTNNIEFQSKVPLMGVRGNHENYDASYNKSNATVYYKYFPYTFASGSTNGDDMYYSFDYGPVHIAVVDQYDNGTYNTAAISSSQKTWLSNDLSGSTKPWKFILLHEPAWSAKSTSKSEHPNNADAQANIHPLCTANDVKMVFGGHNHYYAHALKDGVHHMTLGGGGAPLYAPSVSSGGVVVHAEASYHFAKIDISEVDPKVIIEKPDGSIIETISLINKPTIFTAIGASSSQINLSWTQNTDADDILLVYNTSNTFGIPTGSYSVGNSIVGGGTVLAVGNSSSYNHTGLSAQTYYYQIWSIHNGYYSAFETVQGTPLVGEPANNVTAFTVTGTTSSTIDLTWTDAVGSPLPSAYLIKAEINPNVISNPVDGTPEADATFVKNVNQGVQAITFTGLNASTTYDFKIYPYTNSGANIDYLISSTPTAQGTTLAGAVSLFCDDFEDNLDDWTVVNDATVGAQVEINSIGSHNAALFEAPNGSGIAYYTSSIEKTFNNVKNLSIDYWYYFEDYRGGEVNVYVNGAKQYSIYTENSGDLKINNGDHGTWTEKNLDLSGVTSTLGNYTIKIEGISKTSAAKAWKDRVAVDDVCINGTQGTSNSAPTITSNGGLATANVNTDENQTVVTDVDATDADAGDVLTYSISGGADQAKFSIVAATGVLTFVSAPDYENPTDADTNNDYVVEVTVTDNGTPNKTDVQTITVNVINVNEVPVITSDGGLATASINADENQTAVTDVDAVDLDASTTLTYSITGGADQAKFSINGSTGVLTFASAPDFENPTDADTNNDYIVEVTVSDGSLTDVQTITVNVQDVAEGGITIWQTPGAWSNGVPTATVDAIIDFLYTENINIDCKDLTINAGKNLEIQPGYNVTINGNLTNNGTVICVSPNGLGASGSLITKGTITDNGTMRADRFVVADRWHLMASPLASNVSANAPFNMDNVYTYNEAYVGSENDDAWDALPTSGGVINVGTGYLVMSQSSYNSNFVIPFEGTFNTGDVTYTNLPYTAGASKQGYNLIANPYPSAIDWSAASGWTKSAIDPTMYIWDATLATPAYVTWDGAVGVPSGTTGIIPAMQGFFVHVNNATNSVAMTNDVRLHSTTPFRNATTVNDLLRLKSTGNGYSDETVLYLSDDNFDSEKFFTWTHNVPEIYTIENDKKLVINRLQDVTSEFNIPMGFVCEISGEYKIEATEFTFTGATTITLEDLTTGINTDLSINSYTFNYTQGSNDARFILHFNKAVSINEISTKINIYSSQKTIFIDMENIKNRNGQVYIYNTIGQQMLVSNLISRIDSKLPKGLYIVKVVTENKETTKQVFIY